jgi:hypothetical protein
MASIMDGADGSGNSGQPKSRPQRKARPAPMTALLLLVLLLLPPPSYLSYLQVFSYIFYCPACERPSFVRALPCHTFQSIEDGQPLDTQTVT